MTEGAYSSLKRLLVGRPIPSDLAHHERLSRITGLAVLSSDALSSVAYATEEILRVLVAGGLAALSLSTPIGLVIATLLGLVAFSYRQTIQAYPSGGGAYIVAKDNLGVTPALIAAAALLIDYTLTVAVSIAAGVAAVTSAFPDRHLSPVGLSLVFLVILAVGNLRGIRESGHIFAVPTYFFIVMMCGLIGRRRLALHHRHYRPRRPRPSAAGRIRDAGAVRAADGLLQRLYRDDRGRGRLQRRAGVPSARGEERRVTMLITMAVAGDRRCSSASPRWRTRITSSRPNTETVVSQLARGIFGGRGTLYFCVQAGDDADSGAGGEHRLRRFSAAGVDRCARRLPAASVHRTRAIGWPSRTASSALSLFAGLLLVVFGGDTHALIPLYMIGVFISFTLSQAGMVLHWRRLRQRGWRAQRDRQRVRRRRHRGGAVHRRRDQGARRRVDCHAADPAHRRAVQGDARATTTTSAPSSRSTAGRAQARRTTRCWCRSAASSVRCVEALGYARSLVGRCAGAVTSIRTATETERVRAQWEKWGNGTRLVVLQSPYRSLMEPLLEYIDDLQARYPADYVTVILPEFVPRALVAAPAPQPERAADQGRAALPAEDGGDERAVPSRSLRRRRSASGRGRNRFDRAAGRFVMAGLPSRSGGRTNSAQIQAISPGAAVAQCLRLRVRIPMTHRLPLYSVALALFTSTGAAAQAPAAWDAPVNVIAPAGGLIKTSGCDGCPDAGAHSHDTISGDGFVQFVPSTGYLIFAGLGTDLSASTDSSAIDFAIAFRPGKTWDVRERGVYRADGNFSAGDVFRVGVERGVVVYRRNGSVIYTSKVAPAGTLALDVTLFTAGAALSKAQVGLAGPVSPILTTRATAPAAGAGTTNTPVVATAAPVAAPAPSSPGAAARSAIGPYLAVVDRQPYAKPALPVLGPAGTSIVDPTFGSTIVRVTDGSTRPGLKGRSYRTPSSPHQNAWSAAGSYFYVVSGDGSVIPFAFDSSSGLARRVDPTASGDGGLVLSFYIEPQFSYVNDSIIYGSYAGSGATLRTIDQFDFSTRAYTRLMDLDALVGGLAGTYIGGVASSAGATERILTFFGGVSQDHHHYALVFDRSNPAHTLLLDTVASTLNGAPTSLALNFSLHHAAMDRSGRYVMLYPTAVDQAAPRSAAQSYLWDTQSGAITALGLSARPYGHDAFGYGVSVNQDCCAASGYDAAQWQERTLSSPLSPRDVILTPITPKEVYLSDHTTWNNARADRLMPYISGLFRYGTDHPAWRAWDDEIRGDPVGRRRRRCDGVALRASPERRLERPGSDPRVVLVSSRGPMSRAMAGGCCSRRTGRSSLAPTRPARRARTRARTSFSSRWRAWMEPA